MTVLQDCTQTMCERWTFSGLKDAPKTKTFYIKFQYLTHSLREIISLKYFLKDLYSAALLSHDGHVT